MPQSKTIPNIVARMQQHLTAFDFCLQRNDMGGAKLKAMMMNLDLDKEKQVTIGHGINKDSIPENITDETDLKDAILLDPDCEDCKTSTQQHDIHPPPEIYNVKDKNNRGAIEMAWLTAFACCIEDKIRQEGYTKGWWNE